MTMKLKITASLMGLSLMAGCSLSPTTPRATQAPAENGQGTSLRLRLDFGRSVQALKSDVTGFGVSVQVGGNEVKKLSVQEATDSIDVSGIPVAGNATIHVDAFKGAEKIGEGESMVALMNGRRTLALVTVALTSAGKTEFQPLSPLTMPTMSPADILRGRVIYSPNAGRNPERSLYVQYNRGSGGYNSPSNTNPLGNIIFYGLATDSYQLLCSPTVDTGSGGQDLSIGGSKYKTVAFAASDPVPVSSTQTVAPKIDLDIAWNFTVAEPRPESALSSRTIDFMWPARREAQGVEYTVEVLEPTSNPYIYNLKLTTEATDSTSLKLVLPDTVPGGNLYYRVSYQKPGGYQKNGSLYYNGQSKLIPFKVPNPL